MAIYLKIHYYFYTNWNFQRPMSHLILIWDPLNFYHFWTLQIKLSNFDRSTPPVQDGSLHYLSNKQKKWAYKAYFCEIYGHLLKNSYYFYTNWNFQRPMSHLILIWDPLNFYHFWTLQIKLSNFDRSTAPQRWVLWVYYLSNKQKQMGLQSLVLWNLWPFTEKFLLFLYKFKFSEAYISLNIDLGPIKFLSFLHFADQTEQLWQI